MADRPSMVFWLILWGIGLLLAAASRTSRRLRNQLSRDMAVCIAARSGIARTFEIRDRRITSRSGLTASADSVLTVPSAAEGIRILLAGNAVERIVRGMSSGTVELRGLPAHILWFYELVARFLPWRRRRCIAMPGDYLAPDPEGRVAERIVREPAVTALDSQQTDAHTQRQKLSIWQVGERTPVPGRIVGYRHVVQVGAADSETEA